MLRDRAGLIVARPVLFQLKLAQSIDKSAVYFTSYHILMIVEGVFESCFQMTSVKILFGIVEMSDVCKNKFSMIDISTENNNE